MPIVVIHMLEGKPPQKKRELIRRVTRAVTLALDSKPEQVRVLLQEMPQENWGVAGLPIAEYREKAKPKLKKRPRN